MAVSISSSGGAFILKLCFGPFSASTVVLGHFYVFYLTASEEMDTVSTINPEATTPPAGCGPYSCSHAMKLLSYWLWHWRQFSHLDRCECKERTMAGGILCTGQPLTEKGVKRWMRETLSNDNPISTVLHAKLFTNDWCHDVCARVVKSISDHPHYRRDSCEGNYSFHDSGHKWPTIAGANKLIRFTQTLVRPLSHFDVPTTDQQHGTKTENERRWKGDNVSLSLH